MEFWNHFVKVNKDRPHSDHIHKKLPIKFLQVIEFLKLVSFFVSGVMRNLYTKGKKLSN